MGVGTFNSTDPVWCQFGIELYWRLGFAVFDALERAQKSAGLRGFPPDSGFFGFHSDGTWQSRPDYC